MVIDPATLPHTDPELLDLIRRARERWDAMTPAEQEAEFEEQRRAYVRAELACWDEGTRPA